MAERYSEGKEVVEEAEKLTKLGPAFEKLKDFAEHGQQLSTFQRLYRGEHIAVNGLTPYAISGPEAVIALTATINDPYSLEGENNFLRFAIGPTEDGELESRVSLVSPDRDEPYL